MTGDEIRTIGRARKRKSRGQGLRTRTGCSTCRRKHVKCDEEKPTCGLCAKTGQTCTYRERPVTASTSTESVTPRPSSSQGEPTSQQIQAQDVSPTLPTSQQAQNHVMNARGWPENVYRQHTLPSNASYLSGHSPASNDDVARSVSSVGQPVDVAIANWFGLLAGDAALETSGFGSAEGEAVYTFGAPQPPDRLQQSHMAQTQLGSTPRITQSFREYSGNEERTNGMQQQPTDAIAKGRSMATNENEVWQSSETLTLQDHEVRYMENFVKRVSHWIDLFDPMRHFSILVPHLAMHNVGLLNAVLALSVRHLSLNPSDEYGKPPERDHALQYYYETLQFVQKAMRYDSYNTSLELLATCLIISAYEMLDGSRGDWERHLHGVFLIQRSQVIHGDSKGLRAAVWWAWICQDVWAAFRESRKAFTFWKPARTFGELDAHELASRSVYIMAQVVNFCSRPEVDAGERNVKARISRAESLHAALEDWKDALTVEFGRLPLGNCARLEGFEPTWIHPVSFAVSIQVHYAARVLLLLHRPSLGGLSDFIEQQAALSKYVDTICGIAMTLTDAASGIMSSQCLFIAGTCVSEPSRRRDILTLIGACRQRTGWPINPLSDDLELLWNKSGQG